MTYRLTDIAIKQLDKGTNSDKYSWWTRNRDRMSDEQFEAYGRKYPSFILDDYIDIKDRVSDDLFEHCMFMLPTRALECFTILKHRFTRVHFDWCVEHSSKILSSSLIYFNTEDLLSFEQIEQCVHKEPRISLKKYSYCHKLLTDDMHVYCMGKVEEVFHEHYKLRMYPRALNRYLE